MTLGPALPPASLGIYIHIPFCIKKCRYCDFLSAPAALQERERYKELLLQEIVCAKNWLMDYIPDSIYIGGGTPSLFSPDFFFKLASVFDSIWKDKWRKREVTLEANPGTLTFENLKGYRAAGISRLSIGLQSAIDSELKTLGRIHTYREFLDNFENARKAGFSNINIDLMSGIPGQSISTYKESLSKVIKLNPEHISSYSLILEEGTPFYSTYVENKSIEEAVKTAEMAKTAETEKTVENVKTAETEKTVENVKTAETEKTVESVKTAETEKATEPAKPVKTAKTNKVLPDEEEERLMYHETKKILEEAGYIRYEISNYAKEGFLAVHNTRYWERKDYVGFGLGASSFLNGYRFHNPTGHREYRQMVLGQCNELNKNSHKQQSRAYESNQNMPCNYTDKSNQARDCFINSREDVEFIDKKSAMEEFMFLGLRKIKGVKKQEFYDEFGEKLEDVYKEVLIKYENMGLLSCKDESVFLTESGIDVSSYIMADFLLD